MTAKARSTRESLLDAFESVLLSGGQKAATLDAVAEVAEVSKGGLLYHFKSKDALVTGLIERLDAFGEADLARMRDAPEGPSAYWVSSSIYEGSPFDRSLVAASHLMSGDYPEVSAAVQRFNEAAYRCILAEVGDEPVARAITLMGDGLYYNAVIGGMPPDDADRDRLLDVIGRLRRTVG